MKVRLVVIEAEDVGAEEVAQIVQRVLGGGAPSAPAPAAPALPPAEPPAAALESSVTEPATTFARPPSVLTAMAPMPKTWRPRAKRGRKPGQQGGEFAERPVTPEKFQCAECSADLPEGKDRRSRCPKCGSHAWEKVPAHGGVNDSGDQD